jgi:hypothetical protein
MGACSGATMEEKMAGGGKTGKPLKRLASPSATNSIMLWASPHQRGVDDTRTTRGSQPYFQVWIKSFPCNPRQITWLHLKPWRAQ